MVPQEEPDFSLIVLGILGRLGASADHGLEDVGGIGRSKTGGGKTWERPGPPRIVFKVKLWMRLHL